MAYTYEQLKSMGAVPGNSQPPAPSVTPTPRVSAPGATAIPAQPKKKYTYDELVAQGATPAPTATPTPARTEIPREPGMLKSFARGIFSAPATIVARPFQAVAALGGATNEQIDEFTNKIPVLGGLIEDAPDTLKDVKKDVGRAAQTVALGTGAPIAGGALFGAGTALEQGNDLLSLETAFQTAMGGAGGKALHLLGKPLINAAGKVVGTITPKVLKDVASKGTVAMQEFARTHQLLGGIAAKPAEKLATTLQKVDDTIEGGVKSALGGTKNVLKTQYPKLDPVAHYKAVNERDILRPTTINEPKYAKSSRVYNDAKSRGIDLEKVASERGIIHDKIAEGGRYNTLDTVDNIREGNYKVSDTIARPAIAAAEPGVRRVPVSEVRQAMIKRIQDIPASQIDDIDRNTMISQITKRYADDGAVAKAHPNGYSLTELHDARIVSEKNGKYKVGQSPSAELKAQRAREEGRVFADIFDQTVPDEVGIKEFRKELEKNFLLADYFESLHNKAVPAGITKKAVRLFGKATAATLGGKIGGFPGSILGAQYGDMLFSSFETLPNPIKMKVLQSLKVESPKIFQQLVKYIGEKEAQRLLIPRLPAPSTLFMGPTQGGKPYTPNPATTDVKLFEKKTVPNKKKLKDLL